MHPIVRPKSMAKGPQVSAKLQTCVSVKMTLGSSLTLHRPCVINGWKGDGWRLFQCASFRSADGLRRSFTGSLPVLAANQQGHSLASAGNQLGLGNSLWPHTTPKNSLQRPKTVVRRDAQTADGSLCRTGDTCRDFYFSSLRNSCRSPPLLLRCPSLL